MAALQLGTEGYSTDGTNGKVGIGTSSPAEPLDVNGNIKASGSLSTVAVKAVTNSTHGLQLQNSAGSYTVLDVDTTNYRIGISTVTPSQPLDVNGNIKCGNGAWNGGHFLLGSYHLWVDSSGRLRIKNSQPSSDTDGTVVGSQS
jgi:hypothetical protein